MTGLVVATSLAFVFTRLYRISPHAYTPAICFWSQLNLFNHDIYNYQNTNVRSASLPTWQESAAIQQSSYSPHSILWSTLAMTKIPKRLQIRVKWSESNTQITSVHLNSLSVSCCTLSWLCSQTLDTFEHIKRFLNRETEVLLTFITAPFNEHKHKSDCARGPQCTELPDNHQSAVMRCTVKRMSVAFDHRIRSVTALHH